MSGSFYFSDVHSTIDYVRQFSVLWCTYYDPPCQTTLNYLISAATYILLLENLCGLVTNYVLIAAYKEFAVIIIQGQHRKIPSNRK